MRISVFRIRRLCGEVAEVVKNDAMLEAPEIARIVSSEAAWA
jgi:hypothetical protein